MAGEPPALIKLLSVVTAVVALVVGFLVGLTGYGIEESVFISLTHLVDPGTVGGDHPAHPLFVAAMFVVTFRRTRQLCCDCAGLNAGKWLTCQQASRFSCSRRFAVNAA